MPASLGAQDGCLKKHALSAFLMIDLAIEPVEASGRYAAAAQAALIARRAMSLVRVHKRMFFRGRRDPGGLGADIAKLCIAAGWHWRRSGLG